MSNPIRLILGCGYVGLRVANAWIAQGKQVVAVTRSITRAIELQACGIKPIVWDWHSGTLEELSHFASALDLNVENVLVSVSHALIKEVPPTETHTRGLSNFVDSVNMDHFGEAKWIYLSTTGVIEEQHDGSWVDENTPTFPQRPGSIAALAGEQWIEQRLNQAKVILRPAGIYGPDRLPNLQSIANGELLSVDPESYLNLIHVDDLVSTIQFVAEHAMKHNLYLVSDGNPVLRREYYAWIAKLGNWPAPRFKASLTRDPMPNAVRKRSDGNKRVNSARLRAELPFNFQYPSYVEGLRDLTWHGAS